MSTATLDFTNSDHINRLETCARNFVAQCVLVLPAHGKLHSAQMKMNFWSWRSLVEGRKQLQLLQQAMLAAGAGRRQWNCTATMEHLLSFQEKDGSFRTIGHTISILPVLVGALPYDIADLECPTAGRQLLAVVVFSHPAQDAKGFSWLFLYAGRAFHRSYGKSLGRRFLDLVPYSAHCCFLSLFSSFSSQTEGKVHSMRRRG